MLIGGALTDAPVLAAMKALSAQYPSLRLSPHSCVPASLRLRTELVTHTSPVAPGRPADAPETAAQAHRLGASAHPHAVQGQHGLGPYDFVFDTTGSGQQIKCLTVVDEYTRECLAIGVAGAIRSKRGVDVLSRLVSLHGPLFMRSDNGSEFVSRAILEWIALAGIANVFNDPGKPW